jgi:hypothetical protein
VGAVKSVQKGSKGERPLSHSRILDLRDRYSQEDVAVVTVVLSHLARVESMVESWGLLEARAMDHDRKWLFKNVQDDPEQRSKGKRGERRVSALRSR